MHYFALQYLFEFFVEIDKHSIRWNVSRFSLSMHKLADLIIKAW